MAEGGDEFSTEDIAYAASLVPEDYREEAQEAKEALGTTQPFEPGRASTPYHRGEQVQMQTMQHEQTGLPSYEEKTSFGGDEKTPLMENKMKSQQGHIRRPSFGSEIIENVKKKGRTKLREDPVTSILDLSKQDIPNLKEDLFIKELKNEQKEKGRRMIKSRYPNASLKNLVIGFSSKSPLELVVIGPRGGETPIFLKDGSDFHGSFLSKTYVKNALGKPVESILKQTTDHIREEKKKRDEMRREQKLYYEKKEEKEKELDLKRRIQSKEGKRQQLQDDPSADKKVLKQKEALLKKLKKDMKVKQKENEQLQKNYEDSQNKTKNRPA